MREYLSSNDISFIAESELYRVYAGGAPLFVHEARVSARPVNQVWRGYQRPVQQTEPAAFVSFDMNKPVELRVVCNFEVFNAFLRPDGAGIAARRKDDEVYVTLDKPGNYTLDVNGAHNALHIFANPPAARPPEGALYFGPGIHKPGVIQAQSGQTIYLDEGAIVYGAVIVRECENVRVTGRGILDGSRFHREKQNNVLLLEGSRGVTVDGIVLRDAPTYALSATACENLTINNVKVIGQWRYNADGLDLHNTRHARITDCFVRTFDDCIVLKSRAEYQGYSAGAMCMEDVRVERCVLWNDWGRALEIGAETVGAYMRDIAFRDCDVMHFLFIACDVQACGDAEIYGVTFEDIRVGEPLDPACEPRLIEIFIRPMCWLSVEKLGSVRDIVFRDIKYTGRTSVPCRFIGYDKDSDIAGVSLERVVVNGKALTAAGLDMSHIIVNGYVSGLTVDGIAVPAGRAAEGAAAAGSMLGDAAAAGITANDAPDSCVHFESEEETNNAYLIGNGAFIKFT